VQAVDVGRDGRSGDRRTRRAGKSRVLPSWRATRPVVAVTPMTTEPIPLLARLRAEFPDSSGRRLRTWLAAGRVRVAAEIVRDPRAPVRAADPVTLRRPSSPRRSAWFTRTRRCS
jgi:hypothetical protein